MTEPRTYPDKLEVKPLTRPPVASVRVPGSKSITNRALVLAALSPTDGECRLTGVLRSDDTEVMVASLRQLGYRIVADWGADPPTIIFPHREQRGVPPASFANLFT